MYLNRKQNRNQLYWDIRPKPGDSRPLNPFKWARDHGVTAGRNQHPLPETHMDARAQDNQSSDTGAVHSVWDLFLVECGSKILGSGPSQNNKLVFLTGVAMHGGRTLWPPSSHGPCLHINSSALAITQQPLHPLRNMGASIEKPCGSEGRKVHRATSYSVRTKGGNLLVLHD